MSLFDYTTYQLMELPSFLKPLAEKLKKKATGYAVKGFIGDITGRFAKNADILKKAWVEPIADKTYEFLYDLPRNVFENMDRGKYRDTKYATLGAMGGLGAGLLGSHFYNLYKQRKNKSLSTKGGIQYE